MGGKILKKVSAVCKLCNDAGIPLVPVGSGTGLEGGIVAVEGGIALVSEAHLSPFYLCLCWSSLG